MPAWLTPSHPRFELLLAGLLVALSELELVLYDLTRGPLQVLVAAAVALPVALRFRRPVTAVALTGLAGVAESIQVDDDGQVMLPAVCLLLCLYAVGSRGTPRAMALAGGLAAASVGTQIVVREGLATDLVFALGLPAAGLLIGRASGVLLLETEVLERERDEHTRRAIQSERSRIARELHDVIGHSISVMGVQAGAVRSVLPEDRVREREALRSVERTGRDAVEEMRRLIGLLREDGTPPAGPSPSLARAEALAAEMRAAGQPLTLETEGDLSDLPAGVALAGYRILQEALTNALRHAPGARVRARVEVTDERLRIVVDDAGPAAPGPSGARAGHGLLGMRERAALYGGSVQARAKDSGGFRVDADLPLHG